MFARIRKAITKNRKAGNRKRAGLLARQQLIFEPLENRVLLSADPAFLGADLQQWDILPDLQATMVISVDHLFDTTVAADNGGSNNPESGPILLLNPVTGAAANSSPRQEIVFVDGGVTDYQTIIDSISGPDQTRNDSLEIIILDGDRDGLAQIGEALAAYRGELSAIHIISHGSSGELNLGSGSVDIENLKADSAQFGAWTSSLREDGDILLYGCNVAEGETGIAFVETLAGLTGADIAASTDNTGAAELGGDWQLEYVSGVVETSLPFSDLSSYDHLLDIWTGTADNDTHTGTSSSDTLKGMAGKDTLEGGGGG
jgi:hypothetical protein